MNLPPLNNDPANESYDWTVFQTLVPDHPETIELVSPFDSLGRVLDVYTRVDDMIWNLEIIDPQQIFVRSCYGDKENRLHWTPTRPNSAELAKRYFTERLMEWTL